MDIHKVLNNNVIIALDMNGNELIAMGKGLGFSKKRGDKIALEAIEKIYAPKNQVELGYFKKIVDEKPSEYLFITDAIIQKAKLSLGKSLNNKLYLTLSEYIYQAVNQSKKGTIKTNLLNSDIKRFYPDEYAVALYAIDLIEKELKVKLAEDVAGFIAFHLFTGQLDRSTCEGGEIIEAIKEICTVVNNWFDIPTSKRTCVPLISVHICII